MRPQGLNKVVLLFNKRNVTDESFKVGTGGIVTATLRSGRVFKSTRSESAARRRKRTEEEEKKKIGAR